jgi:hypothetical protein
VKFDGYRCQPHKTGEEAIIFSKNGRDFTNRFPGIHDALLTLPCKRWWHARKTARRISGRYIPATTPKRSSAPGASTSWSSTVWSAF